MRKLLGFLSAVVCWLSTLGLCGATDFSLTATIGGAFDLDLNPISHEMALASLDPVIWKVDFAVLAENLSPDDAGFGSVAFSVDFENASDALNLGWQPYNPAVTAGTGQAASASLPQFFANMDAGRANDDEKGILIHMAPGISDSNDPRLGAAGVPVTIGSMFIQDVPNGMSAFKIDPVEFSTKRQDGKFADPRYAVGQNIMQLPRSPGGASALNLSTVNAPPVYVPPVNAPLPPVVDPVAPHAPHPPIVSSPPQQTPRGPANADFSLSTTIGGAFDLNFNPISHEQALASTEPVIWKVDFSVATDSRQPGQVGFGNVAFSVKLDGATDAMNLGWQSHNPSLSTAEGPSQFLLNMDAGPSAEDEHGILISIAGGVTDPNDPRRVLGQTPGSPDLIGSMFIQDDPLGISSLTVEQVAFAAYDENGKFFDVRSAYGQSTMLLPRSPEGLAAISVSTSNSPPAPPVPPITEPVVPIEPPTIDPPVSDEPEVPIESPNIEPPIADEPDPESPIIEEPIDYVTVVPIEPPTIDPPVSDEPEVPIESPTIEPPMAYEPEIEVPTDSPIVDVPIIEEPFQAPEGGPEHDPVVVDPPQEDPDEAPIHIDPIDIIEEIPITVEMPNLVLIRWPPLLTIDTIATLCCYETDITDENLDGMLTEAGRAVAWDGIQHFHKTSVWNLSNVILTSYGMADASHGMAYRAGADPLSVPEPCGLALLPMAAIGGPFTRRYR
jgi:hypothetical protein